MGHSVHPNRRTFSATSALCAVAVAAPRVWAQAKPQHKRITIAVQDKAGFDNLPLIIAEQLGYFKDEGLNLEILDFLGSSNAMQAVSTGAADVLSGAYEQTLVQQSRGKFCQAFVVQGRAPGISVGVSARTLPFYQTIADLRGKRIGVCALNSPAHTVARMVLWRAGIPLSQVSFPVVATHREAIEALRAGQIDALSHGDPVMTELEQKNEIRIIADTRTLGGTVDVFGGPMPAGCLYAPPEYILRNAVTVQAVTDAMVHSLKWLQTAGPRDIVKTVPEVYLRGEPALYLSAFNRLRQSISFDGVMAQDGPLTALKALARFDPNLRADRIDLSRTYTNEFALKAKARFAA